MGKHLFAAYAWSFHHVGDTSIIPGLLSMVHKQKPDLPVHIMAYQTEDHADYPRIEPFIRQYSPNCEVHPNILRQLLNEKYAESNAWRAFITRWGTAKLGNFELGRLSDQDYSAIAEDLLERLPLELLADLKRVKPETASALVDAGFVVYNSSTSLSYGRLGSHNLWKGILPMMMPMLIARVMKVPYGFSPLSFEALDWPIPLLYRRLFGDARFLYCRDSDSLRYLQQHGMLNRSSGLRMDNSIYFEGYDEPWAERFMRDNDLQDKQFIGLMLRIADPRPGSGDPISKSVSPERFAHHMEVNKRFIEQWVAETGMKVLICHETVATVKLAREHLWSLLSEETRKHCVYMDEFWSAEQAYSIYKRSRILLSMELHSAILALSAGTPIIHHPLLESGRKREMLQDIGIGDWLLDIDECTAEDVTAIALDIHRNYAESEQRIQELLPSLKYLSDAMVSEIWLNWRK